MQIIDRRLNPGGKGLENRQRFLRRTDSAIREAVRNSSIGSIRDIEKEKSIKIPTDGIEEPSFRVDRAEVLNQILPGNTKFVVGDRLKKKNGGGKGQSGAGEGDGTDLFRFLLNQEEYESLFLDDLALPDMARKQIVEEGHDGFEHAGYTTAGSPANLALGRTMRESLKRRIALKRPKRSELAELEKKIKVCEDEEERAKLSQELEVLRRRRSVIGFVDAIDVRYRASAPRPKFISQAVMFCLMDVSGSMTEHMKDLAKRFYILLYIFLKRRYKNVEVVFIRHTDKAEEVDEEKFFNEPASGGTAVSAALIEMTRIQKARFPVDDWNIYVAQASDGDNTTKDNSEVYRELVTEILPAVQYFAYIEVSEYGSSMFDSGSESTIWTLYQRLVDDWPLVTRKVSERGQIFPVFHDLFQKKENAA